VITKEKNLFILELLFRREFLFAIFPLLPHPNWSDLPKGLKSSICFFSPPKKSPAKLCEQAVEGILICRSPSLLQGKHNPARIHTQFKKGASKTGEKETPRGGEKGAFPVTFMA
jgi:hypothetical protein